MNIQPVIDGIGNGAIYAALALAIVVVFKSTGVVNFAQGEFATLSTIFVWIMATHGINIWVALLLGILVSGVVAAALQRAVFVPIAKADHVVSIMMMIGLYLVVSAVSEIVFGPTPKPMPRLFPDHTWHVVGLRISSALIGVLVLEAVAMLLIWLFFERTKHGLAFRAVAANSDASRYVGVNVNAVLMIGWAIAAGLGVVAGVSLTNLGIYLEPTMMTSVLVYSLAAATLGGFDSAMGAVVGGIALGILQSVLVQLVAGVSGDLSMVVALVTVVAVLLARPQGLFGRRSTVRV
jgi:branched-chain amino acid transport system permease protein